MVYDRPLDKKLNRITQPLHATGMIGDDSRKNHQNLHTCVIFEVFFWLRQLIRYVNQVYRC